MNETSRASARSRCERPPSLQSRVSNVLAAGCWGQALGLIGWYYATPLRSLGGPKHRATAAKSKAKGEMVLPPLGRVDALPPSRRRAILGPSPEAPPLVDVPEAWYGRGDGGHHAANRPQRRRRSSHPRKRSGAMFARRSPSQGSGRGGAAVPVEARPAMSPEPYAGPVSAVISMRYCGRARHRRRGAGAADADAAAAEGRVSRLHARDRDRLDAARHDDLRDCDGYLRRGRLGGAARAGHQARRRDARRRCGRARRASSCCGRRRGHPRASSCRCVARHR